MVMCNVYHGTTIVIVMYVKVNRKVASVIHCSICREGRHVKKCRDHVFYCKCKCNGDSDSTGSMFGNFTTMYLVG